MTETPPDQMAALRASLEAVVTPRTLTGTLPVFQMVADRLDELGIAVVNATWSSYSHKLTETEGASWSVQLTSSDDLAEAFRISAETTEPTVSGDYHRPTRHFLGTIHGLRVHFYGPHQ